jgi:aryl-alcohol dehydrogenase-like predicted oxidoreductase
MEYRQLGQSDLKVSVIAFGAWAIGGWMWGGAEESDALKAIDTAIDLGMTSIDTAPVYGMGHSERLVGAAIAGKRHKVQVLTKYGLRWDEAKGEFYFDSADNAGKAVKIYRCGARDSVLRECDDSLKRLGIDYIDLYQMHWTDRTTPVEETMEAVERLIEQGKIRYAGVCNYPVDLLARAHARVPQISNQVPYSMVLRKIEQDLVPWCLENKMGILAYSPLQRGLLTGKIREDHHFNPGDHRPGTPYFRKGNIRKVNGFLDKIRPIADGHGASLAQLVLHWTIRQPGITSALAGARDARQVSDNAGAIKFRLSDAEIGEINRHLGELALDL